MNDDYRNAASCPTLSNVKALKASLEATIKKEHPRLKIIYNIIRPDYIKQLDQIYNHKCAYCGISTYIVDIRDFEIDHYVCESTFADDLDGRIAAGQLSNLVWSCKSCNRNKLAFHIKEDHQQCLDPDNNAIADVFFRDNEYYIRAFAKLTSIIQPL